MTGLRFLTILCGVVMGAGLPGCLHRYRTANVLVRDAATSRPVANVEVGTIYHTKLDPLAPSTSTGITGADGRVILLIAPYHTGKHFYAKQGEHYTFRDLEAPEVEQLARWRLWHLIGYDSGKIPDFVIDVPTETGGVHGDSIE